MINLPISEVGQQSSSQSLKTLGDQRAPVRLASQSTYFREQRGIGLENVEQSLLGKGLGTIFHPKGTCSHHSTVPKPHEILPSLVLIYTSNFKRLGSLDLESSIASAETHTHTLTHSHSHTHTEAWKADRHGHEDMHAGPDAHTRAHKQKDAQTLGGTRILEQRHTWPETHSG